MWGNGRAVIRGVTYSLAIRDGRQSYLMEHPAQAGGKPTDYWQPVCTIRELINFMVKKKLEVPEWLLSHI